MVKKMIKFVNGKKTIISIDSDDDDDDDTTPTPTSHRRNSLSNNNNKNATGTSSHHNVNKESASFQMFKAMETKEEFQKMKLAKFLNDLHELVKEEKKLELLTKVEQVVKVDVSEGNDDDNGNDNGVVVVEHVDKPIPDNGSISLHNLNSISINEDGDKTTHLLSGLTPALVEEKINALHAGEQLDSDSFVLLLQAATRIMEQESTVVDVRPLLPNAEEEEDSNLEYSCTVVGDLHGSLNCLRKVLDLICVDTLEVESRVVIFDGDYVDRGDSSLEVLSTLLLLKVVYPQRIILLRGNHEDTMTASIYGFRDELEEKYADVCSEDDGYFSQLLWEEIGNVFASLPIAARTETAVILHGGIPTQDFTLDLLNSIDPYTRSQLATVVQPDDPEEELIQGCMWSDPSPDIWGMEPSSRGAGVEFGPDVADDFLERENLRYMIRAHEPVEEGTELFMAEREDGTSTDTNRGIVTVFSAAAYPNGEGSNLGAVLNLWCNGRGYDTIGFTYDDADDAVSDHIASYSPGTDTTVLPMPPNVRTESSHQERQQYEEILKSFVNDHRSQLAKGFRAVEEKKQKKTNDLDDDNIEGTVTIDQWVTVVAETLELPTVPWIELQPKVAPTVGGGSDGGIDWRKFLTKYSSKGILTHHMEQLDSDQISILHQHKEKFLNIFNLLDIDGSGTISKDEFLMGIGQLKEQIEKEEEKVEGGIEDFNESTSSLSLRQDPLELFKILDLDGDGEISIAEFTEALTHSATLQNVTKKLDHDQVESLQENHEMLLVAFKYLDTDKSGAIDRKEFQRGIDLLNQRLSEKRQLDDPDELFNLLDADGNGEIDLAEFNEIFRSI